MEQRFKIYFTSDTHGHIFPVNYAANRPEASGLLNMAAQIEKDGDTLVLDGGDSLQGTPLVQYYLEHRAHWPLHPVAAAFNAMGLDYFTLGNHDFNFGYEALEEFLGAMRGQCLCANVQDLGGRLPLKPWAVRTLASGLRVGVTGIVTDYVNVWEQPQNLEQLRITDAFEAARAARETLRPECDVCVCIYHGGFEEELATGRLLSDSGENVACRIARELDFDLLLTGHQHMAVEGVRLANTWAVQPPANAGVSLLVEGRREGENTRFASRFIPAGETHSAQPYEALLALEKAVQNWLDEPIGALQSPIPPEEKLDAALHGSRVAALFNQVQLDATGADVSCTSLGNDPVGLASPVTMRGVTAAYLFANTLVTLEVTEEVIRRIAEQLKLDVIQLHGSESAALADSLRKDYEVWKAVSETFEPDYPADAFLADSSRPGSGNRADGELVRRIRQTGKRWILAGGISEENLSEALRSGADILDVNSSLENFPGRKNILKLNQFMNKYHQYQGDRK